MKKAVLIFVLILAFSGCRDVIFDNPLDPNVSRLEVKIMKIMDTKLSGNGDLCFDGEKLWFASQDGTLYALDNESGQVLREIPVGGNTSGVTFFEGLLYASLAEGRILLVDPLSGEVVNERPLRDKLPLFITNDGNRLIIYDSRSQGIYYYNDDGSFEEILKIPGFQPSGIEYWNDRIVIVERGNLSIYLFKLDGQVDKVYSSPTNYPGGITRDSTGYFYLFSTDGKIYKLSLY